jgi:hypothetical protein
MKILDSNPGAQRPSAMPRLPTRTARAATPSRQRPDAGGAAEPAPRVPEGASSGGLDDAMKRLLDAQMRAQLMSMKMQVVSQTLQTQASMVTMSCTTVAEAGKGAASAVQGLAESASKLVAAVFKP